jgi:hypothetical protein
LLGIRAWNDLCDQPKTCFLSPNNCFCTCHRYVSFIYLPRDIENKLTCVCRPRNFKWRSRWRLSIQSWSRSSIINWNALISDLAHCQEGFRARFRLWKNWKSCWKSLMRVYGKSPTSSTLNLSSTSIKLMRWLDHFHECINICS